MLNNKSQKVDLYENLQLTKKATNEEIKASYKKLALVYKIYYIRNIIPTKINKKINNLPKPNLDKLHRLIRFSMIPKSDNTTISLVLLRKTWQGLKISRTSWQNLASSSNF